jgi:hypothetical protein
MTQRMLSPKKKERDVFLSDLTQKKRRKKKKRKMKKNSSIHHHVRTHHLHHILSHTLSQEGLNKQKRMKALPFLLLHKNSEVSEEIVSVVEMCMVKTREECRSCKTGLMRFVEILHLLLC